MVRAGVVLSLTVICGLSPAAAEQSESPLPVSLERIRAELKKNPVPLLKIDVRSIGPVARFKTTVRPRVYVPTLEEHLRQEFALTALQRQSAQWASQCCGISLDPIFKAIGAAMERRAVRKLREQIQRDLAAIEASRKNATIAAQSKTSDMTPAARRMPDGKRWMTEDLKVAADPSYCYGGVDENCRRYGRLYTWESAQRACRALGDGWRLPTNDEWAQMAKSFGGVRDDSTDGGRAAYVALIAGGAAGFDAVYGGGRDPRGEYGRLDAHGFYWTASESGPTTAWFYNFGKNGQILNRHNDGEKERALAVRCIGS